MHFSIISRHLSLSPPPSYTLCPTIVVATLFPANSALAANAEFAGKRVATTIIGHSVYEGGGDRDKCLEIIEKCTDKLDLTIYDYFQRKKDGEKYEYFKYVRSFAHKDKEKYKELLAGEREEFKKRYLL